MSLRRLVLSGNDMSNLTKRGDFRAVSSYLGDYYLHVGGGADKEDGRRLPSLKRLDGLHTLELENCNLTHVGRELFGDNTELKVSLLFKNLASHTPLMAAQQNSAQN